MGSYRSSGIGSKGSSVSYESSYNRQNSAYSPLKQVIALLEDSDASRQEVARKEQELEKAKQNMVSATQKVQTKLESLDPSTRELIRGMLGQIDGKTDSFTDEETKGRTR